MWVWIRIRVCALEIGAIACPYSIGSQSVLLVVLFMCLCCYSCCCCCCLSVLLHFTTNQRPPLLLPPRDVFICTGNAHEGRSRSYGEGTPNRTDQAGQDLQARLPRVRGGKDGEEPCRISFFFPVKCFFITYFFLLFYMFPIIYIFFLFFKSFVCYFCSLK